VDSNYAELKKMYEVKVKVDGKADRNMFMDPLIISAGFYNKGEDSIENGEVGFVYG